MELFVAAKALIIRNDGKVLLVREAVTYADGTEVGKWDVVGGRIASGEKLIDGLLREIKEESGLEVRVGKLLGVTETFPIIKNEACQIIRVYYTCESDSDVVKLSKDHDQYEWINPTEYKEFEIMEDLHPIFNTYLI